MRKYKYLKRRIDWLYVDPITTKVVYEYEIPNIVADEKYLQKIADKFGFEIFKRIDEFGERPVIRIMQKIADFVSYNACDEFLQKTLRILDNTHIVPAMYCSIIVDFIPQDAFDVGGHAITNVTTSAKFKRQDSQLIIPTTYLHVDMGDAIDEFLIPTEDFGIELYKDEKENNDNWNIRMFAPLSAYSRNVVLNAGNYFEKIVRNNLNADKFEYRLELI